MYTITHFKVILSKRHIKAFKINKRLHTAAQMRFYRLKIAHKYKVTPGRVDLIYFEK